MKQSRANEWRQAHIRQTLEKLNITRKDYKRFLILGNKLHRIYEMYCNGCTGSQPIYQGNKIMNEYTEEMYERDTKPLYEKVITMAQSFGLNVYFQTDPRGATIYLDKEPIPENSYTNASVIY